jgi:DNA-binding NtrC family response regulator
VAARELGGVICATVEQTRFDRRPRRDDEHRAPPAAPVRHACLSEELAASQLFGRRRGAFTGAVADATGVFEAARGGKLFLDEIGDLPPRVQTSLLRVLEERAVMRLGETQLRPVDVRIVAATNRELATEVAAGRFRSDLLYRIRVGRIHLPPLRERRVDFPLLVQHILCEQRAISGRAVQSVSDDAMQTMLAHEWPTGSTRQAANPFDLGLVDIRSRTCPGSTSARGHARSASTPFHPDDGAEHDGQARPASSRTSSATSRAALTPALDRRYRILAQ